MNRDQTIQSIMMERRRLEWTTEELRSYLTATYKKRALQLLSDDELDDFYQYLAWQ